MEKLYHYTQERNLKSIRERGLEPWGLNWLTSSDETETTVNMNGRTVQGRIIVEKREGIRSFEEDKEIERELFSMFMNVDLIGLISDTTQWYYTDKVIAPEDILAYEIYVEGTWIPTKDGV